MVLDQDFAVQRSNLSVDVFLDAFWTLKRYISDLFSKN